MSIWHCICPAVIPNLGPFFVFGPYSARHGQLNRDLLANGALYAHNLNFPTFVRCSTLDRFVFSHRKRHSAQNAFSPRPHARTGTYGTVVYGDLVLIVVLA